ncbi:MAG TPA: endonuclease/exonuclease/phosphatase [Planctomycetaceae bacterium]|nr:endonuclease/exonuclease/phosphatase [Planctomycetaceae bacterium]HRF00867.1 endonuclease/exonuclease/phosphatase family protein [Pirellulaceae bacterium]
MKRLGIITLLVMAVGAAAILFHQQDRIHSVQDAIAILVEPLRDGGLPESTETATVSVRDRDVPSIRIATFNLEQFGVSKLQDEAAMARLSQVLQQFDIVALQEITSKDPRAIEQLLAWVNRDEPRFDIIAGPRIGRTAQQEQYAFLYDRSRVELDRSSSYVVTDPDDLLHREPFVVWGRVLGPEPSVAFTFTLVNVHVDPDLVDQELSWMADVMRGVRNDGRGEDDVILLGDFNADPNRIVRHVDVTGLQVALREGTTNTRGTAAYDNIAFVQPGTVEYLGRSGVFDFYNEFDLTMDEALDISNHLPVWADFSLYEGGTPGAMASVPGRQAR